jgi:glutamine synthetase
MPSYVNDKNVELVTKHGIFTEAEFRARNAIHLEAYSKIIKIEAKTTLDMAIRQIIPAVSRYCADLASNLYRKESVGCSVVTERSLVKSLSEGTDRLHELCQQLKQELSHIPQSAADAANYSSSVIVPKMDAVREQADQLELLTDKTYWPFPTYSDLLFY